MYQEVEKTQQKKKAVAKKLVEKKQKLDQGKQKRKWKNSCIYSQAYEIFAYQANQNALLPALIKKPF